MAVIVRSVSAAAALVRTLRPGIALDFNAQRASVMGTGARSREQRQGDQQGKHGVGRVTLLEGVGGAGTDQNGCDSGGKGSGPGALDPLGQRGHGVVSRFVLCQVRRWAVTGRCSHRLRRKSGSSSGPRGAAG